MKRLFNILMALTVVLSVSVSCRKALPEGNFDSLNSGYLMVGLDRSTDDFVVVAKSTGGINTDLSKYIVTITHQSGKIDKYVYGEIQGKALELSSQKYLLKAISPNSEPVCFDQPIYSCEREVNIEMGQAYNIEMVCVLENVKLTINLSDNFKNELTTYEVSATSSKGSLIWHNSEECETKAGYFPAGEDIQILISGIRAIDGSTATLTYDIKSPAAKDHWVLNIDATTTGDAEFSLSIDETVNRIEQDQTVDGFEEVPVPGGDNLGSGGEGDDSDSTTPTIPAEPSVVWDGNPNFSMLYFYKPDGSSDYVVVDNITSFDVVEAQMNMIVPGKIKDFIVTFSDNFKSFIKAVSSDNPSDPNNPDYLDLINNESIRDNFTAQDGSHTLPYGDDLYGKTEVLFSLDGLLPMAARTISMGEQVDFILNITDEYGQTLVRTLTVKRHN